MKHARVIAHVVSARAGVLVADGCNGLRILFGKSDSSLFLVHAKSIPT